MTNIYLKDLQPNSGDKTFLYAGARHHVLVTIFFTVNFVHIHCIIYTQTNGVICSIF